MQPLLNTPQWKMGQGRHSKKHFCVKQTEVPQNAAYLCVVERLLFFSTTELLSFSLAFITCLLLAFTHSTPHPPPLICSPFLHRLPVRLSSAPHLARPLAARHTIFGIETFLSDHFSMASPQPTTLPTPSFVRSTKLIYLPTIHTDLFHKQPKLTEGGDTEVSASQSNKQSASLPTRTLLLPFSRL